MNRLAVVFAAALLVACSKEKPAESDAAAPPAASVSATPASSSAAPSASAAPAAGSAASYEGKYTAAPGTFFIPTDNKEYAGVKQAKEDGTKLIGDGTFAIAVDGAGQVSGTIDSGPAAPAIVSGKVEGDALNGTVRRKDASDEGLTGTISGKIAGDAIEGTMKLADANAGILREAKFTAKKK